ncbi:hypothetical protein [Desulfosporosinus sp. SB140]|uniref:hypothetical protein n=1 Tax=Desulfosporosinus paludis TaxID=3115649 RepID=UPI00388D23EF
MQLDSWIFLFLNLTILLAVSGITFTLLKNNVNDRSLEENPARSSQITSRSLIPLRFKKYLIIKRMLKQENDDDPPFIPSLVF